MGMGQPMMAPQQMGQPMQPMNNVLTHSHDPNPFSSRFKVPVTPFSFEEPETETQGDQNR